MTNNNILYCKLTSTGALTSGILAKNTQFHEWVLIYMTPVRINQQWIVLANNYLRIPKVFLFGKGKIVCLVSLKFKSGCVMGGGTAKPLNPPPPTIQWDQIQLQWIVQHCIYLHSWIYPGTDERKDTPNTVSPLKVG